MKGIGTFEVVEVEDTSGDPTGELRLDKQIRISEDESVMVTATESDSAALMVVSADNAIARANLDIAAQLEINRHDDETLKEWLDEASTDGDADQMELMAQNNMLVAMQNKKMGEMMDLNASLSSTQLQADRAQMELLQAIEAREKAVASAQAAMRD